MLSHQRELSLMKALKNPTQLDVRVCSQGRAQGILTLDDGVTTQDTRTDVQFYFDGSVISYTVTRVAPVAVQLESSHVTTIVFYGITQAPSEVTNLVTGETVPSTNVFWQEDLMKLTVSGLNINVINGDLDTEVPFL